MVANSARLAQRDERGLELPRARRRTSVASHGSSAPARRACPAGTAGRSQRSITREDLGCGRPGAPGRRRARAGDRARGRRSGGARSAASAAGSRPAAAASTAAAHSRRATQRAERDVELVAARTMTSRSRRRAHRGGATSAASEARFAARDRARRQLTTAARDRERGAQRGMRDLAIDRRRAARRRASVACGGAGERAGDAPPGERVTARGASRDEVRGARRRRARRSHRSPRTSPAPSACGEQRAAWHGADTRDHDERARASGAARPAAAVDAAASASSVEIGAARRGRERPPSAGSRAHSSAELRGRHRTAAQRALGGLRRPRRPRATARRADRRGASAPSSPAIASALRPTASARSSSSISTAARSSPRSAGVGERAS